MSPRRAWELAHARCRLQPQRLFAGALCLLAASAFAAGAARGALLPPRHPARSLALDEHAHADCSGVRDHSATCLDESVATLNAGRRSEHLGPLLLPRNWTRLTVPEQIFMMIELERTARGLQPDTGLAADWDVAARAGANAGTDPNRAGAGAHGGFLSIWAGGQANPIIATVGWVYDDGYFPDHTTQNIACSRVSPTGCWGHRQAILRDSAAAACGRRCAVGAGYSATGFGAGGQDRGQESYAAVFGIGAANNPDPLVFSWVSELPQLPACERVGDTCSWAGRPLLTAAGAVNVRGLPRGASLIAPWFPVSSRWSASGTGAVSLSIAVGLSSLRTVTVTATQGTQQVALGVTRSGSAQFLATGRLAAGRWTVTIRYETPALDGPRPQSQETVQIP
ncbi:MAG: hypothetical protein KGL16_10030 [Acidobacteriota bacterium]|nr:hypothetical protein [Acidobacteriota bacterium]